MLWAWNVVFVCNTESIFLCVSTSEAEHPPATHYHFNHWQSHVDSRVAEPDHRHVPAEELWWITGTLLQSGKSSCHETKKEDDQRQTAKPVVLKLFCAFITISHDVILLLRSCPTHKMQCKYHMHCDSTLCAIQLLLLTCLCWAVHRIWQQ